MRADSSHERPLAREPFRRRQRMRARALFRFSCFDLLHAVRGVVDVGDGSRGQRPFASGATATPLPTCLARPAIAATCWTKF